MQGLTYLYSKPTILQVESKILHLKSISTNVKINKINCKIENYYL